MKEYKMVHLNKGLRLSREKDLEVTEDLINQYMRDGWELQQVISPNDGGGAIIGLFCKEKYDRY
ncbi:MAG: DUF4177 domain-containing protein [Erysipelotrichaceae bacterium]|nr:DUF4177 domain-containing protein [Erysipelotrichaceae bacterium]